MSGVALAGHTPASGGWLTRHTRSILAIMLAFVIAGGLAATVLPTGLFPVVQFPRLMINVIRTG